MRSNYVPKEPIYSKHMRRSLCEMPEGRPIYSERSSDACFPQLRCHRRWSEDVASPTLTTRAP
jgi:hypothetical protein